MAVRASTLGGLALVACLSTVVVAPPASAAVSYTNCTALQKTYPHGVGRATATDRVTSGKPVTTWRKDTAAYNRAIRANKGLDRDKDFVACEKR
jgi:hypothetical protein